MDDENVLEELDNENDDLVDGVDDEPGKDDLPEEDVDRGDELSPAQADEGQQLESGENKNNGGDDLNEDALKALVGDEEDGETDQGQSGTQGIPFSRFQEVNLRMQEAERKLADLKGSDGDGGDADSGDKEEEEAFNFADREQAYTEALLDGDSSEAAKIREEINNALRDEMRREANELATKAVLDDRQARQQEATLSDLNTMAINIASNNHILDEKSPDYNPDMADEVVEWSEFYINKGTFTPAAALEAAAKRVLGSEFSMGGAASDKGNDKSGRTKAAIDRGIRASQSQPPKPGGLGRGERAASADGDVSVKGMSEDDFDKLSEAQKSKLRGD